MPSQILIRDPTAYPEQRRNISTAEGLAREDDIASVSTVFIQPEGRDRRKDATPIAAASLLRNDISASPRLYGYCVCLISSIVSMISSSIFYTNGTVVPPTVEMVEEDMSLNATLMTSEQKEITLAWFRALNDQNVRYMYGVNGNFVQRWQAIGSMAVSGLMSLVTLLVVIAHFDSYFFPRKFRNFFADGSKSERNLLFVLITISICALQINTSRFSVGEAQANVFFSTWTSFIALIFNYELWRTNAGRHLTFQNVLFDVNFPTKRFWLLLAIFSTIAFLAFLEHILHHNFWGEDIDCTKLSASNLWLWLGLVSCSLSWGFIYYRNRRLTDVSNPKLLWVVETTFASALVAIMGAAISNLTGGLSDKVPCPSNLYFGLWGAFVVAVWILGSLLQNHHIT